MTTRVVSRDYFSRWSGQALGRWSGNSRLAFFGAYPAVEFLERIMRQSPESAIRRANNFQAPESVARRWNSRLRDLLSVCSSLQALLSTTLSLSSLAFSTSL